MSERCEMCGRLPTDKAHNYRVKAARKPKVLKKPKLQDRAHDFSTEKYKTSQSNNLMQKSHSCLMIQESIANQSETR